ncbi:hypothetical protein GCM10009610_06150 [Pseudonocardia xinjiangensis]
MSRDRAELVEHSREPSEVHLVQARYDVEVVGGDRGAVEHEYRRAAQYPVDVVGGELAQEWADLKLWTIGRVALRHNFQPRELGGAHFGSAGA